jgi:hypothetical protein
VLFVAKAEVDGEVRRDLPVILDVTGVSLLELFRDGLCVGIELVDLTEDKIEPADSPV